MISCMSNQIGQWLGPGGNGGCGIGYQNLSILKVESIVISYQVG